MRFLMSLATHALKRLNSLFFLMLTVISLDLGWRDVCGARNQVAELPRLIDNL